MDQFLGSRSPIRILKWTVVAFLVVVVLVIGGAQLLPERTLATIRLAPVKILNIARVESFSFTSGTRRLGPAVPVHGFGPNTPCPYQTKSYFQLGHLRVEVLESFWLQDGVRLQSPPVPKNTTPAKDDANPPPR